jgi:hypothetical protein
MILSAMQTHTLPIESLNLCEVKLWFRKINAGFCYLRIDKLNDYLWK